jgi:hypothetical protein
MARRKRVIEPAGSPVLVRVIAKPSRAAFVLTDGM